MLGSKCMKGAGQVSILSRNAVRRQDITKKVSATYNGQTDIHSTAIQQYPQTEPLPLPSNIDPTETTRFSRQRSRDINSTAIFAHHAMMTPWKIDITVDSSSSAVDPRVESYDCFGAVSLNASMQSNVPSPFGGLNKFTHLNMPGGQWGQESKFMSNDLNSSHYINLRREVRKNWFSGTDCGHKKEGIMQTKSVLQNHCLLLTMNNSQKLTKACVCFYWHDSRQLNTRSYSTIGNQQHDNIIKEQSKPKQNSNDAETEGKELSRRDKLKKAVKEYGSTVIVFHVGISLVSLGAFYMLVSSGIDIIKIFEYFGWQNATLTNKMATGASTFVMAYAVHKIFAPVRISITLAATPLIVRYLRRKGILRPSK